MTRLRAARAHFRAWARRRWPTPGPQDQAARTAIVIQTRKAVMILAVVVMIEAIGQVYTYAQSQSRNSKTEHLAHASCTRTRRISPELADAYRRYHILDPHTLHVYLATIPRSC
jgi:hypothetical protein